MSWASYETRHGRGWIGWDDTGAIDRLVLPGLPKPDGTVTAPPAEVERLAGALAGYFDGSGGWPSGEGCIVPASATAFDTAVYQVVTAIPAGTTMTYSQVASRVGRPGAARAVGAAMAKNRFAPMIPCHRVVGSDGSLRGYAGGLAMKQALLDMEADGG